MLKLITKIHTHFSLFLLNFTSLFIFFKVTFRYFIYFFGVEILHDLKTLQIKQKDYIFC